MATSGPVLALLPFTAAGGEGDAALIAQGLLEDVGAELARFRALQVVSWMSSLEVANLPGREAGARLGATHLLRGRLRRSGDRLRITASLEDAATGAQIWSERFDAPAAGAIFEVQDEIVARIAATLTARLEETALREARRKPPESLAAYELTVHGMALVRQGTVEADAQARELFRRAVAIDRHYARAYAGLSLSYFNEWSCQFWGQHVENGRHAYAYAHQTLDLDDTDPLLHVVIGRVHLFHRRFEQAAWYFDRAHALCPNDAECLIQLASCEAYLGRAGYGRAMAEKAMRLHPYHPGYYFALAALPYLLSGETAKAIETCRKAADVPFVDLPAYLAIAHAHQGDIAEARRQMALYVDRSRERIAPGRQPDPGEPIAWFLQINPFRRPEDVGFMLEGFQLVDSGRVAGYAVAAGAAEPEEANANAFVAQGDSWIVAYGGRRAVLADMKGLHDLRRLLSALGEEIHCLDLAERAAGNDPRHAMLDARARRAYQERIRDLQEDLVEAEDMNDLGRAERVRAEMDRLIETLASALSLGGRSRRLGDLTERARTTVTWRIRHAIRRIEAAHEPLGRHLVNSVRTGTFCSYRPERPVRWQLAQASDQDRGTSRTGAPAASI